MHGTSHSRLSQPEPLPFWRRVLITPWPWAVLSTWGFYQLIPHLPVGQELAVRYFCSHPLEYALCGLFFIGISIIAVKAVQMIFERRAFRAVPDFGIQQPTTDVALTVATLNARVGDAVEVLAHTYWGRRLQHLLTFFQGRTSADGLNDHLSYLSEADADRQHASHSLLQTVIWSIPILGFLGTVMGITLAIANVTPEQLESSLDDVTGGLAVAFDTTALALSLSLVLGFLSLFVKRSEERLLSEIDERCRLEVHRCFPRQSTSHPLMQAEERAAETLVERTNALIERQMKMWAETLSQVRQEWTGTIDEQRKHLAGTIQEGTEQTLTDHAEQLARVRQDLLSSQEEMAQRVAEQLNDVEDRRLRAQRELVENLREITNQFSQSSAEQLRQQGERVEHILGGFAGRMQAWEQSAAGWQEQMQGLTEALTLQSRVLLDHGEQLAKVVSNEESLMRLQENLTRNLEAVRNAETFDETLHNLSAAVHLLTVRSRGREAA